MISVLAATAAHADPFFLEVTDLLGDQPCNPEGCYSHYAQMADLDSDGDLDFLYASGGEYFVPGKAEPLLIYLTEPGPTFAEVSDTALSGHMGRHRQVAIGDIDSDGDLDLIAPDSYGDDPDNVFINDGTATFIDEGPTRLAASSRAGAARLGDMDGDGDLDLVLSDWGDLPPGSGGTAEIWTNDGTGHFTELVAAVPQDTSFIGTGPVDIDLADVDGDWDLDILLASQNGDSLLFLNDGTGLFTNVDANLPPQPGPYTAGPDVCDVDGDGDLDLWLDNGAPQLQEQLLTNNGFGVFTDVTAIQVDGAPGADDNEVQCVDLDDDGDFDAIVAAVATEERLMWNVGVGNMVQAAQAFAVGTDTTLGLDLGDLDGDGRLDVVTAQGESGDYRNRLYLGTITQVQDTLPPVIRATESMADGLVGARSVRFAVSDRVTSDTGPRLTRAWLTWTDGVITEEVDAHFIGGDLFRATFIPTPEATITWFVCATDPSDLTACGPDAVAVVGADPPPPPPPTTTPPPTTGPTTPPTTTPPTTTTTPTGTPPPVDTGEAPPVDDDPDGCGCQASPGPSLAALMALVALRRRRK